MDSNSGNQSSSAAKKLYWAGVVVSVLPIGMLIFSAVMKLSRHEEVMKAFTRFEYPATTVVAIGIVELVCVIIYAIPQTSVLGAILLTGYLGGATATHVRISDTFFATAGPVMFGVLVWVVLAR